MRELMVAFLLFSQLVLLQAVHWRWGSVALVVTGLVMISFNKFLFRKGL